MIELYDDPAQMEALVVHDSRPLHEPLMGLAHELSEASACLDASLAPTNARSLSELVAGMNYYNSNLIEGHRTLPLDIAQAQNNLKANQKDPKSLASAHIAADRWARSCPWKWCKSHSGSHGLRHGWHANQTVTVDRLTTGLSPTSTKVSSVM